MGETGIEVSEIGFGTWGIGGIQGGSVAYGVTDDSESRLALRLAFDSGITFYDTSDLYGCGHSEQLVGETFKEVRQKVVLATKGGFLDKSGTQDFAPQYIRRSLEESLRRLQTDYVDIYQLHSPPLGLLEGNDPLLTLLASFVKEGKVRVAGISVRSPEDGFAAVNQFGFKVVQVNFNMMDQRALSNGFFNLCEAKKIGLIARTPLFFGFLSGQYSANTSFGSGDHRGLRSPEQLEKWRQAYGLFAPMLKNGGEQTEAQKALRFCLSYPISTVIPGMLTREEVKENAASSVLGPLSSKDISELEKIYKTNEVFLEKF